MQFLKEVALSLVNYDPDVKTIAHGLISAMIKNQINFGF